MVRLATLAAGLFLLWILLSGMFKTMLLSLGVVSVIGTVYLAHRMKIIDDESVPLQLPVALSSYWGWLGREIFKANVAVAKIILSRDMALDQKLVWVPTSQTTDTGRVIYANSITLTPGTVTVETEPGRFLVHGLNEDFTAIEGLKEMDRRCTEVERR